MAIVKKLRSWLAETHGPQFELVRHFLSEQLAHDLIASDQVRKLVITVLAVLACIGPLIVRLYIPKYNYLQNLDTGDLYIAAVRADRLFFITLSMLAASLVTVIQWQGLFPSLPDYLALKPLPVRLYRVFLARFLSAFVIVLVVISALDLPTSVLFPFLTSGRWQSPSFGVRYILAHATATLSAGVFAFFTLTALQGTFMNLFPPRIFARISVLIQALFATASLTAVSRVLDMPHWHKTIASMPRWMLLFPPAWFLGVYESLLGARDFYFRQLCERAVVGVPTALFLAVATYFLCYHRHARRVLEQSLPNSTGNFFTERSASAVLDLFVPRAPERGTLVFAIQTLRRSRHHKLITGFSLAIALVLALQAAGPATVHHLYATRSWPAGELESILAAPLVVSAALISALCYVFHLPSDLKAAWIFRIAERTSRIEMLDSVESFLGLCGLAPVLLFAAPYEALTLGWPLALTHSVLIASLALLFIEVRLYDWNKIPFTCSYVPGRRNFWQTIGAYLLLFAAIIPTLTYFEARLLPPFALLVAAAAISVGYFFLRSTRRARQKLAPLLFDESDEPLLGLMRLNRE
jgi:hypothetical protein